MKITICDVCKHKDNKVVEGKWISSMKGYSDLKLDLCDDHKEVVTGLGLRERMKFVYDLFGFNVSETDLDRMTKRRVA